MPETLFSLAEQIRRCTSCPLYKNRMLAVPGEGKVGAKLMLIGEAPGAEEDRIGLPFVGRSGKFLDVMLSQIGLGRGDVFVTGACKCRPPQNRVPTSKELVTCRELWLQKQISLVDASVVVLLGGSALWSVVSEKSIAKFHGKVIVKDGRKYFVTYHPSAGMRFPAVRKAMEKDFLKLKLMLNAIST